MRVGMLFRIWCLARDVGGSPIARVRSRRLVPFQGTNFSVYEEGYFWSRFPRAGLRGHNRNDDAAKKNKKLVLPLCGVRLPFRVSQVVIALRKRSCF